MKRSLKLLINRRCNAIKASPMKLGDIFEIMFSDPDLIFSESNDGYRIIQTTYGQIKEKVNGLSAALFEKIGSSHSFVGLEMENSNEWIIAFWAILKSGNKPFLVNTRHPKSLSDGIINTLDIKYIVSDSSGQLNAEYIIVDSISHEKEFAGDFENEFALSTSATSLQEVVCVYNGEAISHQILNAKKIISDNKRMAMHYKGYIKQLAFLPFYHIFGLFAVYFWFAFFGRTFVFLKDYSPQTIIKTCQKHEITHIFAVPLLWHTVESQIMREVSFKTEKEQKAFYSGLDFCTKLQNVFPYFGTFVAKRIMHQVTDKTFGKSIRFCISGGSYLKDSSLKLFNGLGYSLHNGFGMSEIGITSVELRSSPSARNKNSIGLPFETVKYRISENGTLLVGGDTRCSRVILNGVSTDVDEWLDTLDIVKTDEDGYYYIEGRASDVVIGENGENINPDVIEKRFEIPAATAFSVLGIKTGETERLSMVVQISPYLSDKKIMMLKEQIFKSNESLPVCDRVSDFYFTHDDIMAKTAIKVGRKYLLNGINNGTVNLIPFSDFKVKEQCGTFDSNSLLAKRVREIVSGILDIEITADDCEKNLMYDFSVTSLQYFSILSALAEEFGITNYSEKEQYRYTIREFCEFLERYI